MSTGSPRLPRKSPLGPGQPDGERTRELSPPPGTDKLLYTEVLGEGRLTALQRDVSVRTGQEGAPASSYLCRRDLIAVVHRHHVILTHGVGHVQGDSGHEGGTVEQVSVEAIVLRQALLVVGPAGPLPLGPHSLQRNAHWEGIMPAGSRVGAGAHRGPSLGGLTCAVAGGPLLLHVGLQLPENLFPLQQLLGPTDLGWRQPNVNLAFGIWGGEMEEEGWILGQATRLYLVLALAQDLLLKLPLYSQN